MSSYAIVKYYREDDVGQERVVPLERQLDSILKELEADPLVLRYDVYTRSKCRKRATQWIAPPNDISEGNYDETA